MGVLLRSRRAGSQVCFWLCYATNQTCEPVSAGCAGWSQSRMNTGTNLQPAETGYFSAGCQQVASRLLDA
jgi:hypothetical protein